MRPMLMDGRPAVGLVATGSVIRVRFCTSSTSTWTAFFSRAVARAEVTIDGRTEIEQPRGGGHLRRQAPPWRPPRKVDTPTRKRRQDTRMHPPGRTKSTAHVLKRVPFLLQVRPRRKAYARAGPAASLPAGAGYFARSWLISAAARSMAAITRSRSASDRSRILGMERLIAPIDGVVRAANRRAEARALERAFLSVEAAAALADALEFLLQVNLVGDGVRGETVQAVAAHQRLAPLLGLKGGDGLAQRAGVRAAGCARPCCPCE